MSNIFNIIDEMESYFDTCKKVPFSNKISVDIEVIYEFMTDLRMKLPEEIKKAERIIEEKEKIIYEAKESANNLEKEMETHISKMVNEHEIMQKAYKEAEVVLAEAKNTSRELKLGAYEYVDELIAQLQVAVQDTLSETHSHFEKYEEYLAKQLDVLEKNRQELLERKNGKKR